MGTYNVMIRLTKKVEYSAVADFEIEADSQKDAEEKASWMYYSEVEEKVGVDALDREWMYECLYSSDVDYVMSVEEVESD